MSKIERSELLELFRKIEDRLDELTNEASRASLVAHLRSLARWMQEPLDHREIEIPFPEKISIAAAVCHPECGCAELIVDGNTQECQHCGGLMFRTEVREYRRD